VSDIQLDDRLMQSIKNVNTPKQEEQPQEDAKVINLFDDEEK